jgi:hypothetical protein
MFGIFQKFPIKFLKNMLEFLKRRFKNIHEEYV